MARATPLPLKSYTVISVGLDPSAGAKLRVSLPGPGTSKSVDRYCTGQLRMREQGIVNLISESMTTDDDRLSPSWHRFRDLLQDDGFSEDSAA